MSRLASRATALRIVTDWLIGEVRELIVRVFRTRKCLRTAGLLLAQAFLTPLWFDSEFPKDTGTRPRETAHSSPPLITTVTVPTPLSSPELPGLPPMPPTPPPRGTSRSSGRSDALDACPASRASSASPNPS
ncbi:hypothetical protein GCM10010234_74340 [Streptomyces hawaiiensis]